MRHELGLIDRILLGILYRVFRFIREYQLCHTPHKWTADDEKTYQEMVEILEDR